MKPYPKFDIFNYYKLLSDNVLINYKGPLDNNILGTVGKSIRSFSDISMEVRQKLFKVFIELAQNIAFYSDEKLMLDEKEIGIGTLLIHDWGSFVTFIAANKVSIENAKKLRTNCAYINSLNRENLRKYKRQQRSLPRGIQGGANIGLIHVALVSGKNIDYEILETELGYALFSITVNIEKE